MTHPNTATTRAYFQTHVDAHHRGETAPTNTPLPTGVTRIDGHVTDRHIVVHHDDGTTQIWRGGQHLTTHNHRRRLITPGPLN